MIVSNQCPGLSNDDWKYLGEIRDVLKPFMKAHKMLEGEKYVTSSWVLETLQMLWGESASTTAFPSNKYDKVAHNLAKVLLKDLKCRWGESSTYDGMVKRGRIMNRQVGVHPALVMAFF
jgi:hypothetical protein